MASASKNMTIANANGTYRICLTGLITRLEGDSLCLFGDVANKLGEYESIGTPDEIKSIIGDSVEEYKKSNKKSRS